MGRFICYLLARFPGPACYAPCHKVRLVREPGDQAMSCPCFISVLRFLDLVKKCAIYIVKKYATSKTNENIKTRIRKKC